MDLDWSNLTFSYRPVSYHLEYHWKDGKWDDGELKDKPFITLSIAAECLHYGQAAFEGLKAYRGADGKIRVFREEMNAQRLFNSAMRTCMAPVPVDMFCKAVERVVKANEEWIPPYGTGATLYIRPLLFGSGPQIGVAPAAEYTFIVMVVPVGAYYKGGLQAVKACIVDEYDRAAPRGTGNVKLAGNYAASLLSHEMAHKNGYAVDLYLDAAQHKYIEEFGSSNFIGITKDGKYVTPKSSSVLPSITNNGLQQVARDLGIEVEVRPIDFEKEIGTFAEVAACGTAVVITPVSEIVRLSTGEHFKIRDGEGCGPVCQKLYDAYTAIQWGKAPDTHGWLKVLD
ncbi:MAG: branched-chain amino acid aminotransferase [Lentisphaeria bacterium]|nr:branched-chain amino acid aminotransferase [Lentisphaeria bacterium]